jgi:hypothetical protein
MCKVLAVAGIKSENVEKLWQFLIEATPYMTANDKDGVGYSAQYDRGLFGERWLYPNDSWKLRTPHTKKEAATMKEFNNALQCPPRYNNYGDTSKSGVTHAVTLHSRMATCGKGLDNTHPFVSQDGKTSLIHNGIISNSKTLTNLTSTCDSETILNEYTSFDVTGVPQGIDLVAGKLRGYYACAVLTTDANGNQYMDIFKDETANLVATYIPQLDAMVFCTKADIVKDACKKLKWKWRTFFEVKAGEMIRINAVTGAVVGTFSFTPKGYETSSYSHSDDGFGWGNSWEYGGGYRSRDNVVRDISSKVVNGIKGDSSALADKLDGLKSAKDSAKVFEDAGAAGVLVSDDGPTDEELEAIEREAFRQEIEGRMRQLSNGIDDDNDITSPFHVKAGS